MMPNALKKRSFIGLGELLEVHLCQNLVIELKVLRPLLHNSQKGFFVHKVRGSEVFGVGVESRGPLWDNRSVAVAVVSDLVSGFAVNYFDGVVAVLFVAVALCVDIHAAVFENVDALVSQRLINEVVGRKEAMDEFAGDGALETVGPLCEKEERGFDDA